MVEGGAFSPELRNAALDAIYGPSFDRFRANPSAGNVHRNRMVMRATEWKVALDTLGVRV
jgi:hypothetical protein